MCHYKLGLLECSKFDCVLSCMSYSACNCLLMPYLVFQNDPTRSLPDYFAVAVDYVAEKLRAERQKGLGSAKFLTVHMDYSTPQDVPHQLEASTHFNLLRDIHSLIGHLSSLGGTDSRKSDTSSQSSLTRVLETETWEIFQATLEQAKIFFKDNPSWMDDFIEQIDAPFWSLKRSKRKKHRGGGKRMVDVVEALRDEVTASQSLIPVHDRQFCHVEMPVCNLPLDNGTSHLLKCQQFCLGSQIGFQGRQNSLPSSLASSVPPSQLSQNMSKSLDSVIQGPQSLEVPTCLFCGSVHTEGRPVCRSRQHRASDNDLDCRSSVLSRTGSPQRVNSSLSQSVLQAEVHHEWGPHMLDHQSHWQHTDLVRNFPPTLNQQRPLDQTNHPSVALSLSHSTGLQNWSPRPPHTTTAYPPGMWGTVPSQSQPSIYTDDSSSVSDSDSLERDLWAIQHISSFQDFVNSTTFTLGQRYKKSLPVFGLGQTSLNTASPLSPATASIVPDKPGEEEGRHVL